MRANRARAFCHGPGELLPCRRRRFSRECGSARACHLSWLERPRYAIRSSCYGLGSKVALEKSSTVEGKRRIGGRASFPEFGSLLPIADSLLPGYQVPFVVRRVTPSARDARIATQPSRAGGPRGLVLQIRGKTSCRAGAVRYNTPLTTLTQKRTAPRSGARRSARPRGRPP